MQSPCRPGIDVDSSINFSLSLMCSSLGTVGQEPDPILVTVRMLPRAHTDTGCPSSLSTSRALPGFVGSPGDPGSRSGGGVLHPDATAQTRQTTKPTRKRRRTPLASASTVAGMKGMLPNRGQSFMRRIVTPVARPERIESMTEDMRALWNREAETFDQAADHGLLDPSVRRTWSDLLLSLIGPKRGQRVADLGCGTGTLSTLLASEGAHLVHGVDFSPEMIRRAREKAASLAPRPIFTEADAADPPLPKASFDVVLCRHVLWAMPDPSAALEKWIELLAPGGVLILIEGHWSNGAGLPASECVRLVEGLRTEVELQMLTDPAYWGAPTVDERYLIRSRH